MTKMIIARHGNTFSADETPRRVGKKTNLPLVPEGRAQAEAIGRYLKEKDLLPHYIFTSRLQRTMETAYVAMQEAEHRAEITPLDIFDEIDYGPDENKTEDEVIARLGEQALKDWDDHGAVPDGWKVNPEDIQKYWRHFAKNMVSNYSGDTILIVTSNGIARFAPYITGNFEEFAANNPIKIKTGALCILEHDGANWGIKDWNRRP